jgi:hypothetical protein
LRSTILTFGRHNDEKSQPKQKVVMVSLDLFAHRHWQIGRLDKRSIGLDGVQVSANCTAGTTKYAASSSKGDRR